MHKLDRNMPCWCGSGKKYKHCHFDFDEKLDDMHRRGAVVPTHDMIKTEAQIAGIRESAKINVAVLDYVAAHIRAGISTAEIDRWVYEQTTAMGGIPAPLNYEGFPRASARPSTIRFATASPPRTTSSATATSSTSIARRSTRGSIPIPPACSSSARPRRKRRSSSRLRASA